MHASDLTCAPIFLQLMEIPWPRMAPITWSMRCKWWISPRFNRLKPPQTSQDISCTEATAQSVTGKALALCLMTHFLQYQHVFFHWTAGIGP